MKPTTLIALAATAALAACGPKASDTNTNAQTAAPTPAANASAATNMAAMGMSADAKMAKGTGTVTAVDAAAGTVTLQHSPIPEAGWPAMTMAFKANPEIIKQVKAGDKVAFDLKLEGGAGEVTAVHRQ